MRGLKRKRPQDADAASDDVPLDEAEGMAAELARLTEMLESVQSSLTEEIQQLRGQVRDLEERLAGTAPGAGGRAGRGREKRGEKRRMRAERRARDAGESGDEAPAAQTDGPA